MSDRLPCLYYKPVLLSSRKVLVLEDPPGPIFKSSSLSLDIKSLSLKLDSLSLSLKSLTTTLAITPTAVWSMDYGWIGFVTGSRSYSARRFRPWYLLLCYVMLKNIYYFLFDILALLKSKQNLIIIYTFAGDEGRISARFRYIRVRIIKRNFRGLRQDTFAWW